MGLFKRTPPADAASRHPRESDHDGDTQFPRRARRHCGRSAEAPGLAVLVFEDAHLTAAIPLQGRTLSIGRDSHCDIRLRDSLVSRLHCTLRDVDGGVTLVDEGSTNGTFRNGRRVTRSKVADRDLVSVGGVLLKLVALDSPEWRMHRSIYDELYIDDLTGLLNRRGFRTRSDALHATAEDGALLGLIMIDADLFKAVNDTYGHPAGDAVIAAIGDAIRACLPGNACAGRLGGEEFAVLVSGTTLSEMSQLAAAIHRRFAAHPGRYGERAIPCTLSIGVSARRAPIAELHALFATADAALYEAKARGRNGTVFVRERRHDARHPDADADAEMQDATVVAQAVRRATYADAARGSNPAR